MQNEKTAGPTIESTSTLRPEVGPAGESERRVYAATAWLHRWLPPEGGVPSDPGWSLKLPF